MDETTLQEVTRYLRSEFPMPSEAYDQIAMVLEALWAENKRLAQRVEALSINAHTQNWER